MTVATRRSRDGGFTIDFETAGGLFDPAVVAAPTLLGERTIAALVVDSVTNVGSQFTPTTRTASAPYARHRVIVGGKDITYFRGIQTPMPTYALEEPLLYGSGQITFPQIHAAYERPGYGDLSWLTKFATVRVQRVDADGNATRPVDYVGFIADFTHDGRNLSCTLGGQATGRLAMADRPPVPFPNVTDIAPRALLTIRRVARLPIGTIPTTGVRVLETGGTGSELDFLTDLLARSTTRGGAQWTVMPDSSGRYQMARKNLTTIDATVYIDGYRVSESLKRDFTEEPNRVWATAIGPDGMRIRFAVYPGLTSTQRPAFPGSMSPGDSGDGVTAFSWRLFHVGVLDDPPDAWTTDDDDPITLAVEQVQDDANLSVTGVVNNATWNAIFDADVTGRSLKSSRIIPAAQRPYTYQKLLNASGQIIGDNPKFDRSRPLVDVTVDMGQVTSRRQAVQFAKQELADDNTANWVGTVTVNTGAVIDGEHNPGDPLTADLVRDARTVKPGMNLWLPTWDGGTLVHVSGVSVSAGSVEFTVDTRARDTMKVWEVIARNRESRRNPSRQWIAQNRRSAIRDDTGAFYDGGLFGKVERTFLPAGQFTRVRTAGGRSGVLQLIDAMMEDAVEFAFQVWSRDIDDGWVNRKFGDPFRDDFEDWLNANMDAMHDKGLIDHWGWKGQPCGYGRAAHVLGDGSTSSAPLTGRFRFAAGTPYYSRLGVMSILVFPKSDTHIKGGRVLELLLDDGAS